MDNVLLDFKNYQRNILNNLLIFLLVLSGGSYLCTVRATYLGLLILTLFFLLTLFLLKIKFFAKKLLLSFVISVVVITIILFIVKLFAAGEQLYNQYIIFFIQFLIGLIVYFYYKSTNFNFLYDLYKVLKFIMYYSLISFFMWFIIKNSLQPSIFENTNTFVYLFFYDDIRGAYHIFNFEFIRNAGPFWEPGILQYYMNLLFFLALFYFKDKITIFLSSFVIFTTWSTTGLIIWSFIILYYIMINMKKKKVIWILPFITFIALLLGPIIEDNVKEKIEGDASASSTMRAFNSMIAMYIIEDNILHGIGLDWKNHQQTIVKYQPLMKFYIEDPRGAGISNSFLNLFVYFGIPLGLLFLLFFYRQAYIDEYKNLFFMITILTMLSEPIFLFTFFHLFFASGMMKSVMNFKELK